MEPSPHSFFRSLRERKIVQWLVVYLTGSWATLEVVATLAETVQFLESVQAMLPILIALGIPVVLVLAWYHGEKGRQRFSGAELVILATLLAGLGGVFTLFSGGRAYRPRAGTATVLGADFEPAPAIAVLPSVAAGAGAEDIGEGIVSVLSSGLDAVSGWRAVSPRTVRARWAERVPEGGTADESTALEIAVATGATYAVLPTTTVLGSVVRVSVDIYDLRNPGAAAWSIERSGNPGDLLPLADGLAVEILGAVLQGEGQIPAVDLSRTTSESPEALRAFLQGEVLYREYRLEDARDAFNLALDHDPTFARAHYRLMEVHGWGATMSDPLVLRHQRLARENIGRLTNREALVIQGLTEPDLRDRFRLLEEAVARYPDDATAWYWLGEQRLHNVGGLANALELEEPFLTAIQLDPGRAALYPHAVLLAFTERADSALATELVSAFVDASSGVTGPPMPDVDPRGAQLALDLAFGDETAREAAWIQVDAEVGGATAALLIVGYLYHPHHYEKARRVAAVLGDRPMPTLDLFDADLQWRGHVREGLSNLDDVLTDREVISLHDAFVMGLASAIPRDLLLEHFGPAEIHEGAGQRRLAMAGMWAADDGRWEDHRQVIELLTEASEVSDAPDNVDRLGLDVVEAYGTLRRGEPASALPALVELVTSGRRDTRSTMWALGEAYTALGRWADAERVFRTSAWAGLLRPFAAYPMVRLRLAHVLEAQNRVAEAVEAYAYFVEHWATADPELQPIVQDARDAIARLSGGAGR